MSQLTPRQREALERYMRISKWSAEEREQHYERNKEYYDKLDAELENMRKPDEYRISLLESFYARKKDEEEKRKEEEEEEGNTSSTANSWVNEFIFIVFIEALLLIAAFIDSGSKKSSSDTNVSGRRYDELSDEEYAMVWHNLYNMRIWF